MEEVLTLQPASTLQFGKCAKREAPGAGSERSFVSLVAICVRNFDLATLIPSSRKRFRTAVLLFENLDWNLLIS